MHIRINDEDVCEKDIKVGQMNKSKKSILNAIAALLQMVVTSVLGLVLNKSILEAYGSAYNGINATITQIINSIMIVEGGFTLASNVALFEPWLKKDKYNINGILSATRKRFTYIGWIALGIGTVISFLYPISSMGAMSYWMGVGLMWTILLPTCFNLGVTTKYRVLLLTEQKEYVISIISTITYVFGTLVAIFTVRFLNYSLLTARIIIMFSLFANYIMIGIYCRQRYPSVSFYEKPLYEKIKGTKSVMAMKLTSVIYSSAPIIVISLIPEKGLVLASVYAVYNSVMSVVSGGLNAIVNAPRLSFGALFAEKGEGDIARAYSLYETITFVSLTIVLGTTALMLMPFVRIYTQGIADADYCDTLLAGILIAKYFFEIVHIPSGQMIQMSGHFDAAKKIQIVACIVLCVTLLVGLYTGNVYVVVLAMLLAAIVLAVLEIFYSEVRIIKRKWGIFLRRFIVALLICAIACLIGMTNLLKCNSYFDFLVVSMIAVIVLLVITLSVYYVIDKECTWKMLTLFRNNIIVKNRR